MENLVDILTRGLAEVRAVRASGAVREWVSGDVSVSLLEVPDGRSRAVARSPDGRDVLVLLFEDAGALRELVEGVVREAGALRELVGAGGGTRLMVAVRGSLTGLALVGDGWRWAAVDGP